jgi:hypothetical protein
MLNYSKRMKFLNFFFFRIRCFEKSKQKKQHTFVFFLFKINLMQSRNKAIKFCFFCIHNKIIIMCSQVKVMQYQREKPITNDISLGFENNFFNGGRYKIKHSKFLSEIRTARYIKILFLLSIDYFQFFLCILLHLYE